MCPWVTWRPASRTRRHRTPTTPPVFHTPTIVLLQHPPRNPAVCFPDVSQTSPKNIFWPLFVRIREYFFMTTIFAMTWVPFFPNQSTLGVILARIFEEFAQIFRDFAETFTDFAQIFTTSRLSRVRLHPRLLHHWSSFGLINCFRGIMAYTLPRRLTK